MTHTEKAAYLKGLLDGLNIDKTSDNGKAFGAIADMLSDLAMSVSDLEEQTSIMGQELDLIEDALDEIDEVIDELDEAVDELYDDEDEDDTDCGIFDDEDEDDDMDDFEVDELGDFYQIICPTCGEEITVDEGILAEGKIKCPACGEDLEFDLSDLEDGCSCGCCGCDNSEEKE